MPTPTSWTVPARQWVPFAAVGATGIVAGGLVAAVTGPAGWEHGSWVAAFLVLVVGVGQIGLAAGQTWHGRPRAARSIAAEAVAWNLGSAFVILGTLVDAPWVVTVGGLLLVAGLGLFASTRAERHRRSWTWPVYRALVVLLLVSTPVGLVLAWLRA